MLDNNKTQTNFLIFFASILKIALQKHHEFLKIHLGVLLSTKLNHLSKIIPTSEKKKNLSLLSP